MKPLAIDLYCGLRFGWTRGLVAEGWRVIGYDVVDVPDYPGEFRRRDVRAVSGYDFERPALIVASPPCEEFTRHQMPWTRARNPPEPDLSLVEAVYRIRREAVTASGVRCERCDGGRVGPPVYRECNAPGCIRGTAYISVPLVLENVRAAQGWIGKARAHYGSRYLWGDVPALLPFAERSRKEHLSSTAIAERAEIPFDLARFIAVTFKP